MQTRQPKSGEAPLEQAVATWDATAAELGFDLGAARLRNGGGFDGDAGRRVAAVSAAINDRDGAGLSPGERRALV